MTTWFEYVKNGHNMLDPNTVEFQAPVKRFEHVDSSTIVEIPASEEEFLNAYNTAIERQKDQL